MEKEKIQDKIKAIEQEIQKTPYHKGTEHHIGRLKARLANLREQLIFRTGRKSGGSSGFGRKKQGDATVVLVGMPSVGKSTLLNKLTGAKSKVGHYDFTTLDVVPGILNYKGATIQIFDVPGLIQGAARGKGEGKEILSVVRVSDLLVLIAAIDKPGAFGLIEKELKQAGVRINKKPPRIKIEKKIRGGVEIQGDPGLSQSTVKSIAQEFKTPNAKIVFGQRVSEEELIDAFVGNRVYIKTIRVLSKADLLSPQKRKRIKKKEPGLVLDSVNLLSPRKRKRIEKKEPGLVVVSVKHDIGINDLKQKIFDSLELIQVYLQKSPDSLPGNKSLQQAHSKPLICRKGDTVKSAAALISKQLAKEIEGARINGPSARFPNQKVGLDHKLENKDIVFFLKKV